MPNLIESMIIAHNQWISLKILVTGGAGYIGRHLVKNLIKNNQVLVYDNLSNSSDKDRISLVDKGVKFLKGDILDYDVLCEFSKDVNVVIHLAAMINVNESVINPEFTKKVNVDGTVNVLKCCIKNKIKKIIFASSAAVYEDSKEIPINENSTTNPQSPYGQSKLDAEKIIVKTCQENNIDHIIFRMFNVYGKGQNTQYAGVITKFFENIRDDNPLVIYGDGEQTRDFVSINDVVEAFDCATKLHKNGTYNIASGKSLSINELAQIMFEAFGKKLEIKHKEMKKDEIKYSVADVSLTKNKLGFVAKKSLKEELSKL